MRTALAALRSDAKSEVQSNRQSEKAQTSPRERKRLELRTQMAFQFMGPRRLPSQAGDMSDNDGGGGNHDQPEDDVPFT